MENEFIIKQIEDNLRDLARANGPVERDMLMRIIMEFLQELKHD